MPNASEHVVAWYRTIRNREEYQYDPRAADFFDTNDALRGPAEELKRELTKRLRREGTPYIQLAEVELKESADGEKVEVTHDHLQPMCDEIETRLREIIIDEIRAYWSSPGASGGAERPDQSGPSEARRLELEAQAHQLFGESRAPQVGFVGRDLELKAIAAYLRDENDHNPLVVHGPSGTGKTALLARAAQLAKVGGRRVFVRFLGTTPQSSDLRILLRSLCRSLRPVAEVENKVSEELRELQEEFDRLLGLATAEKPILLFLDALDQLGEADGARQVYWLHTPLPPHVKAVISCICDEEGPADLNEPYRVLERRKLLDGAIAVESLTAPFAMRAIDLWLQLDDRRLGRRRQLTEAQHEAIATRIMPDSAAACRRPLYLRILFEECRLWPSWKAVRANDVGEDTGALLEGLFRRLAQPAMHGRLLVESALSYIASSRRGLGESEILELLWADPDYRLHLDAASRKTRHELPPYATRIPIAIWSRLRHDLDPYLAEQSAPGANVLTFYHRQVTEWAKDYLARKSGLERPYHERLAKYFHGLADPAGDGSWNGRSLRGLSELPFHQCKGELWAEVEQTLCNLNFVEAKCISLSVFDLLGDFDRAIGVHVLKASTQLRRILGTALPSILARPQLTLQTICNRLMWIEPLEQLLASSLVVSLKTLNSSPYWIKANGPLPDSAGAASFVIPFSFQSFVQAVSVDKRAIVIVSRDGKAEIRAIPNCKLLGTRQFESMDIIATALGEEGYGLSYMQVGGLIRTDQTDLRCTGRKSDKGVIAYHSQAGVFAVTNDNTLLAWNPISNRSWILSSDLPRPTRVIKVSPDGGHVFFLTGDIDQIGGLSTWSGSDWATTLLPHAETFNSGC